MGKYTIQRSLLTFASILFLLFSYAVVLVPHSFAEQQLVCPTPAQTKSGNMQMSYCYVVDTSDPSQSLGGPNQAGTNGGNTPDANGVYTSDGTAKTAPGCSQTCPAGQKCQQLCGQNVGSNINSNSLKGLSGTGNGGSGAGGAGLGGLGSLFSNLPILSFLLPAGQPASTTPSSAIGLSPLSQLIGASTNVQAKGNNIGNNIITNNNANSNNSGSNSSGSNSSGSSSSSGAGGGQGSLSGLVSQVNSNGGAVNGPGGSVCTPDALENGSCECPSYQETNFVCEDRECSADGGIDFGTFLGGVVPGIPAGANCAFSAKTGPPKNRELSCVMACNSKPIIYLYPTKPTNVDVQIAMEGHVTVSDPHYSLNGWQNVQAQPNGDLTYSGKHYHELYYESETIKLPAPKTGIFLSKANINSELESVGTKLGLNAFENDEFVSYWAYRLKQLDTPYIFFSIFDEAGKAKVDDVQISPKPDTFIGFLAYFKPVQEPYTVEPLQFPSIPPRKGFTAVEWGGTIDE